MDRPRTLSTADFPPFQARAPWWGADLQTLRNVLRGPAIAAEARAPSRGKRLILPLGDGSGDRLSALLERPAEDEARPDAPLAVLIHGLGGSEESTYLQASAAHLLAEGVPVLRLNLRGAGPSRALCQQQYHAGRTRDLRDALTNLPDSLVRGGLVLVGFSLGGNMLLKFLAEGQGLAPVRAAASISAPIDLAAASKRFLHPRNRFYHLHLLTGMKREALGEGAGVSDEEREVIPTLGSILEFDEKIVAPRGGFAGAADYYAKNHARQFLGAIRVPTLVIQAQNDPWIPARAYTSFDWSSNPALVPLLPRDGGHLGFHGRGDRRPWFDVCLTRLLGLV
jgi:predicted alpha/beta-fold hydrolase